jgi:hypothetical protein
LERAYQFFNDHFFGGRLPQEIALSVEQETRRRCRGYFCARLWHDGHRHLGHIALATQVLCGRAEPVLAVLLHEMVHLRNHQTSLPDCHPRNQYHNRHFRDTAGLAGLACEARDPVVGYALTTLNEHGRKAVAELRPAPAAFRWVVRADGQPERG